jgi:integrase-like protein
VFCRPGGSHEDPTIIGRRFTRRVRRLATVPVIGLHGPRHTHATLLLEAGVDVKTVSERLGHDNVQTTLDLYGHVTSRMRWNAAARFGSLLTDRSNTDHGNTRRELGRFRLYPTQRAAAGTRESQFVCACSNPSAPIDPNTAAAWRDLYIGMVGAGASLTGLTFVAIALDPHQIERTPLLRLRAANAVGAS